uniref:myeloid-derived growth factor isoform X2 n=1 Tax=Agelaius phoeniceus TaxID=39638 RepID=UPI0023ED8E0D|nr:myeloid-derived growth factor isoform X2 [Agelaius phoeniceus]
MEREVGTGTVALAESPSLEGFKAMWHLGTGSAWPWQCWALLDWGASPSSAIPEKLVLNEAAAVPLSGRGITAAPSPTRPRAAPTRPQGKSYLFFTQFKAEVKGAKIEHAMAYSQAAAGALNDIPLKQEEFGVTESTVSHREGKFRFELSKLMIVAKTPRDEL